MGDSSPRYIDFHRAFLQSLMAHGSMTLSQAAPVLARLMSINKRREISAHEMEARYVDQLVERISEKIAPLDYEIRTAADQRTGERVWTLVNRRSDPATQMATTLVPDELSFVKRLLDVIFDTNNTQRSEKMCVTMAEALMCSQPPRQRQSLGGGGGGDDDDDDNDGDSAGNANAGGPSQGPAAAAPPKALRHSEVQRVMRGLIDSGWLDQSRDKYITLSTRGLLELRDWLVARYNDPDVPEGGWQRIKQCEACREIVSWGQRCAENTCHARLHDGCADKLQQARGGGGNVCPRCDLDWSGNKFVGERAITSSRRQA